MKNVIIIGGGAAGMMAAVLAGRKGHQVHLYEKNEKLGKKLFITGKGRCNITNAGEMEELFAAVVTNQKFLYSSFYGFTNQDVTTFFEELGVAVKIERGNRVFPVSDHSSDVIGALMRGMNRVGVKVHLNTEVKELLVDKDQNFTGISLVDKTVANGDACIVATGGYSYQTTGSTGDGYRFAEKIGHKIAEPMPALVPMEVEENFVKELQGLSLRNIKAVILDGKKELYREFGEMLFTHYGVSGPLILSASSIVGRRLKEKKLQLCLDLKPALSFEQLDQRVVRDFEENKNKQFKNALGKLFPSKLIPVMIGLSGISGDKKIHDISKEERQNFVHVIKNMPMTLTKLRGFNEAIITKGGIQVKEIAPGTMESKLAHGVYFAGEVLDLDALTGGFNLQIAWSTAAAAAESIE